MRPRRGWGRGGPAALADQAPGEDQADLIRAADVEVVAQDLLEEDPPGQRGVQDLGEGELALDEVPQICPIPLPLWMADSGEGILIIAVCHGLAQLEARWHHSGARAIWGTAGIKVIL